MVAPVGLGRGAQDYPGFPVTLRMEGTQLQKEKRKKEGNPQMLQKDLRNCFNLLIPTWEHSYNDTETRRTHEGLQILGEYFAFRRFLC